ncbi:MAG: hypothetical protein J1E34_08880 [Oscillospiraceae bacterium]|nr:hypothetical protein [Oscillospiraceae bacterium]
MEKLRPIDNRDTLNEVVRTGKPDKNGAYHTYVIQRALYPVGESAYTKILAEIRFQQGMPGAEIYEDGVIECNLLEIVRDRLISLKQVSFGAREIEKSLTHIEEALMWLKKITADKNDVIWFMDEAKKNSSKQPE